MPRDRVRRTLAEQLRDLVGDRGLSGYALAKAAGLNRSIVTRFMAGGSITLETLDALAGALGLRLVDSGRGRRAAPRPAARRSVEVLEQREHQRREARDKAELHEQGPGRAPDPVPGPVGELRPGSLDAVYRPGEEVGRAEEDDGLQDRD
jgi:transcriptional regulator with XRE-family HTH domain